MSYCTYCSSGSHRLCIPHNSGYDDVIFGYHIS